MRLNSKGQITIPADLRRKHGFHEGDEVDVVEDGDILTIVHRAPGDSKGARLVQQMRGRGNSDRSTDELMDLLRGE